MSIAYECEKSKVDVLNVPKLRTYVLFKNSYKTEPYVSVPRNRRHRSMMAQFRCGILPLRVETGTFMSIPQEYRLCLLCDTPNTEDVTHFLFHCKFYTDNRKDLFSYAESKVGDFRTLDIQTKFQILMSTDSMEKRRRTINLIIYRMTIFVRPCPMFLIWYTCMDAHVGA